MTEQQLQEERSKLLRIVFLADQMRKAKPIRGQQSRAFILYDQARSDIDAWYTEQDVKQLLDESVATHPPATPCSRCEELEGMIDRFVSALLSNSLDEGQAATREMTNDHITRVLVKTGG